MNVEDFGRFSGSLAADIIEFNHDAIPKPSTLVIRMKRGERRIADELRKTFGGFERVAIDVDGERHEFGADSLIRLLESYEDASRYAKLFGTPERAMHTIALIGDRYPCDEGCDPLGEKCNVCPFVDAPSCRIDRNHPEESPLLEWLGGNAQ